jgi:hypothetical protein
MYPDVVAKDYMSIVAVEVKAVNKPTVGSQALQNAIGKAVFFKHYANKSYIALLDPIPGEILSYLHKTCSGVGLLEIKILEVEDEVSGSVQELSPAIEEKPLNVPLWAAFYQSLNSIEDRQAISRRERNVYPWNKYPRAIRGIQVKSDSKTVHLIMDDPVVQ